MTLPNDISRCTGVLLPASLVWGSASGFGIQWKPEPPCVDCQRRTDPGEGDHISNMPPPEFIDGICPMRIAPGGERP